MLKVLFLSSILCKDTFQDETSKFSEINLMLTIICFSSFIFLSFYSDQYLKITLFIELFF